MQKNLANSVTFSNFLTSRDAFVFGKQIVAVNTSEVKERRNSIFGQGTRKEKLNACAFWLSARREEVSKGQVESSGLKSNAKQGADPHFKLKS